MKFREVRPELDDPDPARIDQGEESELGRLVRASRRRHLSARAAARIAEGIEPARAAALAAEAASNNGDIARRLGGAKAAATALALIGLGAAFLAWQTRTVEDRGPQASARAPQVVEPVPPLAASPTVETPSVPVEALPSLAPPAVVPSAGGRVLAPRLSSPSAPATPEVEFAFIKRAEDALSSDPSRALAISEEHASRFPAGEFVQEREMVAVEALARLGQKTEAKRRANALLESFPRTPYVARLERALGEPLSPAPPATPRR